MQRAAVTGLRLVGGRPLSTGARRSVISKKEIFERFRSFDKDGDGFITSAEIKRAIAATSTELAPEDIDAIVKEADIDGDGRINYNEFVNIMATRPGVMSGELPEDRKQPYDRKFG